jgi:thioredoxin-related protein
MGFAVRILPVVFALSLQGCVSAGWTTDYPRALEQARKQDKLVLVNFTGSDWCGWCIKLERDVFATPQFQEYAKRYLVLVTVDFPERKPQPDQLKKQNQQLAKQFEIDGYPTIILLGKDGMEKGRLGYVKGGTAAFLAKLDKLRSNKKGPANGQHDVSP